MAGYLDVKGDDIEPILDVTIDGRHIEDGDYVGSRPLIVARIWDENKFILKQDTLGVRLLLKPPCKTGCGFAPVYFGRPDVEWFPATDSSDFMVEYHPHLDTAGEYRLRVEIADGSGNALPVPYEARFVVGPNTVLQFAEPYPNPSAGEVFFGFTVSGNQPPQSYQLGIYDLEGRLVKLFSNAQRPMHIGHNQLIWTGNNETGAPMKGGMYIYKFGVTVNGSTQFKNGKLVLIR